MATFRAIEAGTVTHDGETYHLDPTVDVSDTDPAWAPLLAARPDLFGRFHRSGDVEQATAAPGEKRGRR